MVGQVHHGVSLEACPEHGLWMEREQLQRILRNMLESFELGWAKATREQVEIERTNEEFPPFDILLDGLDWLIDKYQKRRKTKER
jgi:Zn-finger nucleic acid-binding protein